MQNEPIIVKMVFGSHLYGTNTPSSDVDYKGVFLPTKNQVLLGKIPKSYLDNTKRDKFAKNTSHDVDIEMYSLHYFIKLACEGQTVALDMLHAPEQAIITSSPIWDSIVQYRSLFYTKNLKAFIGYARRQASKYGIKGSRLQVTERLLELLQEFNDDDQMKDLWHLLPMTEHCYMSVNPSGIQEYQICGKKFPCTAKVGYVANIMGRFYRQYGARAQQAKNNEGIDWKAVSHALRAAFQVKQLLTEQTITFPLREAPYLTQVKRGELDYTTEVAPRFEQLMEEVEELSKQSNLPDKVEVRFWNDFIIETMERSLFS